VLVRVPESIIFCSFKLFGAYQWLMVSVLLVLCFIYLLQINNLLVFF